MKLKKLLAGMVLAMSLATVCIPAMPAQAATPGVGSEVTPNAEERQWFFRMHNGKLQRRLWSITYGKWLTDWIDCK